MITHHDLLPITNFYVQTILCGYFWCLSLSGPACRPPPLTFLFLLFVFSDGGVQRGT